MDDETAEREAEANRVVDHRRYAKAQAGQGEHGRCVGCGVPAVLIDGVWINPGPGSIPSLCGFDTPVNGRLRPRAHGPFVPADPPERTT